VYGAIVGKVRYRGSLDEGKSIFEKRIGTKLNGW